jgi:hypothetical protein
MLILTGGKMIKDHLGVMEELKNYASPKARLSRMIKSGSIIQVRRGLFTDDKKISPKVLAPVIYGPSYLSFEYALSSYGLIPERVTIYTSASYKKNRDKIFHTPLGDYYYYYLPSAVYPYGLAREEEKGNPYLIALPEKALCDALYKTSGINTLGDLEQLLLEDWRIEKSDLMNLDSSFIAFIAPLYRRKPLKLLYQWLRREIKNA